MDCKHIRNFCIVAHIDHGKSTLADRLIEKTGTVSRRELREQLLDDMELERERGITIKARAVAMRYTSAGQTYELNLIDTPGHVDFHYEVSRSLACCEGALLLVDACQGVEAQTVANAYAAIDAGLTIVPALNKIDVVSARPDEVMEEMESSLGIDPADVLAVSAKTGVGVDELLEAIIARVPPPQGDPDAPLQAMVFDSHYDEFRGAITYVRLMNGTVVRGQKIKSLKTGMTYEVLELGQFVPDRRPCQQLQAGQVGYLICNIKTLSQVHIGDTVTVPGEAAARALPGYQEPKRMVFCGLYPSDGENFEELRESLTKLSINDPAPANNNLLSTPAAGFFSLRGRRNGLAAAVLSGDEAARGTKIRRQRGQSTSWPGDGAGTTTGFPQPGHTTRESISTPPREKMMLLGHLGKAKLPPEWITIKRPKELSQKASNASVVGCPLPRHAL